ELCRIDLAPRSYGLPGSRPMVPVVTIRVGVSKADDWQTSKGRRPMLTMTRLTCMAAVTAASLALGGAESAAEVPESKEPIKLVLNEWTGQLISSHILGGIY